MQKLVDFFKSDFSAALVVYLLAIPLCMGVGFAVGLSPISGLISGVIGGIVVGLLSSSTTSVSAPAAGLTAIVIFSIHYLNSIEAFFLAVFVAGIFQILLGMIRAGFIAAYLPSSVIRGLISAVGIILILKQIPHAIGFDRDAEGDFSFFQPDGENTFSELFKVFNYFLPGPFINTALAIFLLIGWNKIPFAWIRRIPSPVVVVFIGVLLNEVYREFFPDWIIEKSHLINIPELTFKELVENLPMFHFQDLGNYKVWLVASLIALMATLETLLNLESIDRLDPQKRRPPPSRELIAQGVGNIFASILGGLPIASVIVRSSVNIELGSRSKLSTILQGVFLFITILFLTSILNLIPLSSLAAILIVTGYRLSRVSIFKEIYKKGSSQFIPYVVTILAILFTDLLIGVSIGLMVAIFFILRNNYQNPFTLERKQLLVGETLRLELTNQVTFLNKASIKSTLWHVPENTKVIIDASYCEFIDKDVQEVLLEFKEIIAPKKNIQVNLIGLKDKYELSDNIQFVNVSDKELQARLTPTEILEIIKQGNERFVAGIKTEKYYKLQVGATSGAQYPMVVVLSCIDSRTSPEIILDAGLGDLVSIRVAGNVISKLTLGSIEIACAELGAKLIVVMGHSSCGAVKLAIESASLGSIPSITKSIAPAIQQVKKIPEDSETQYLNAVSWLNVHNSVSEILSQSKYIRERVEAKKLMIVSAFYNVETGQVRFEK